MANPQLPTIFEGLIVLVFGRIQVGKSSFINCITNSDQLAIGQNLGATTNAPECVFATIDSVKVAFVDTPGFDHPNGRSDADIITEAIDWVKDNLGGKRGFTAVIDLHSINDDIEYRSALDPVDRFYELAGGLSKVQVGIASTHWDVALVEAIPRETKLRVGPWVWATKTGVKPDQLYNNRETSYSMLQRMLRAQHVYARSVEVLRRDVSTIGIEHVLATMQFQIAESRSKIEQLEQILGESETSNALLKTEIENLRLQVGNQVLEAFEPLKDETWSGAIRQFLRKHGLNILWRVLEIGVNQYNQNLYQNEIRALGEIVLKQAPKPENPWFKWGQILVPLVITAVKK